MCISGMCIRGQPWVRPQLPFKCLRHPEKTMISLDATQVDDSNTFPSVVGSTFPNNFKDIVKKIFKRLFRVYAHIYRSHFHQVCQLKAEAHLNTCFKHFILFAKVVPPSPCSATTRLLSCSCCSCTETREHSCTNSRPLLRTIQVPHTTGESWSHNLTNLMYVAAL